ncbi:hypothetical protein [Amycolatopsis sp. H20-H5]|uniref:hypothetical protein n=1 Tax=Amycolatopsis sp. H20-H5 TaxID=3046309 RepID=UPI002DB6F44E|nr:hypothetical protein [Amycolatopsis sp. H20-H5]MEC3975771.1 hypothetical protein [Amycolatopsis sp. H20-H5]
MSLARVGFVAQSPGSGRYDVGPAMRRLGIAALRRMDEVALVSEHLPTLRDRTGHAVNLAAWADHGPVIVRWDYGSYAPPITVRVGDHAAAGVVGGPGVSRVSTADADRAAAEKPARRRSRRPNARPRGERPHRR